MKSDSSPSRSDQPAPSAGPAPTRTPAAKPLWVRLATLQEFGLCIVIAVMMLGLTLASPLIPEQRNSREFEAPAGATVTTEGGVIRVAFTADGAAQERTFSTGSGWRLTERAGRQIIERIERREFADATVSVIRPGWRFALPGQEAREYIRGDGWDLVESATGRAMEREDTDAQGNVKKERIEIPSGVRMNDIPSGVRVTRGSTVEEYYARDGWRMSRDATNAIEREPRVNRFLRLENLVLVATQASFIAIMAVGMTAIIVLGGIDLSVGSIYALSAVIGAIVLNSFASSPIFAGDAGVLAAVGVALLVCCGVGAVCGFINGAASVGLNVHPFIITLGGMAVYRGVAFVGSKGLSIGDFPPGLQSVIKWSALGVSPVPMLLMFVIGIIGALVFSLTVFGRRIFAIGGNETAAKYAGVPVGATKIWSFTICGMLAGLSAVLMLGYFGAASSDAGNGYELNVIAAAVVGGASLSGGRGSALGAVLGALIIQLINNGFDVLGLDQNYRQIVIGMAIVLAVVVDQAKYRLTTNKK